MEQEKLGGGALFLLLCVFMALVPLLWLSIFGFQTQNLQAIVVSTIFFSFLILPFVFDFFKFTMPSSETYGSAAFSFTVGGILAVALNWQSALAGFGGGGAEGGMSIFSVPINYLLSSISGQLPQFWNYFVNIFGAAVSEEMLFLITLPIVIFLTLDYAGRSVEILKNKYLQIVIAGAIASVLFAGFHVGNLALTGFIVSSIIFRSFLIGMVWGDSKAEIIPYLAIVPSFAIGFHLMNNFCFFSLINVFQSFITEPFGIAALIFIFSSFALGLRFGLQKIGIL